MQPDPMSALGFRATERVARRNHRCYDCDRRIPAGERYRDVVAAPWYDFNPRPGHWTRAAFCLRGVPDAA